MKGLVPEDEVSALAPTWQCEVIELQVPQLDEQRHLLILEKIKA